MAVNADRKMPPLKELLRVKEIAKSQMSWRRLEHFFRIWYAPKNLKERKEVGAC